MGEKMKVIAINGSPRKTGNTAALLNRALEGSASRGAATGMVNLYDLDFKGCVSCFACKRIGGKSYGRCARRDGLTPVLEKIAAADALIFGSPIYFGGISGEMHSFLERLIFPYLAYDEKHTMSFPKKIRTGWIYTMNIPAKWLRLSGYRQMFTHFKNLMIRAFGASETLVVTDTWQFDDYSKYVSSMFDAGKKAKRRRDVFPRDCAKAFAMGVRMATPPAGKQPGR